jgi:hypothetical protein
LGCGQGDDREGELLLLRHQRPHPDHLWPQLRCRRGRLLSRVPRGRHPPEAPFRDLDRDGVGRLVWTACERGSRSIPISSWAPAASMAAIPRASTFSKRWASTTSPARPTECRSPVSPPRKQRVTIHFPPPMVSRKMRQARSGGIVLARKPSQGNRR